MTLPALLELNYEEPTYWNLVLVSSCLCSTKSKYPCQSTSWLGRKHTGHLGTALKSPSSMMCLCFVPDRTLRTNLTVLNTSCDRHCPHKLHVIFFLLADIMPEKISICFLNWKQNENHSHEMKWQTLQSQCALLIYRIFPLTVYTTSTTSNAVRDEK